MSGEPSMEEILSSIKRIIAEEGEGPIRGRRAGRPLPAATIAADEPGILELSDPMPAMTIEPPERPAADTVAEAPAFAPDPIPEPAMPRAEPSRPEPAARPESAAGSGAETTTRAAEPLSSPRTAQASRSALDSLSRLMVRPEPGSDGSLEGLVRDMLRPMIAEWLDTNLPALVESMVETEIARITGQSR